MKKKAVTRLRAGFSLIEVIVSVILIALTLLGLSNLFLASKAHIQYSRARMTGGELGRVFLDPLQMQVRQDNWNDATVNALSPTVAGAFRYCDSNASTAEQPSGCPTQNERILGGVEYSVRYEITNHTSSPNIRKVITTITWPKVQP
jgi:prepilin-type N-terminal cleavage/methylation domain-containing protein